MMSGLEVAIAHVAGPILAPFFRRVTTTEVFRHPTALSKGRIPL